MTKRKPIDETADNLGLAILQARQTCHISVSEAARLLRISPLELLEYEHGTQNIPVDVLQYIFFMGYKLMRMRVLEDRYRRQRNMFRRLKQTVADMK